MSKQDPLPVDMTLDEFMSDIDGVTNQPSPGSGGQMWGQAYPHTNSSREEILHRNTVDKMSVDDRTNVFNDHSNVKQKQVHKNPVGIGSKGVVYKEAQVCASNQPKQSTQQASSSVAQQPSSSSSSSLSSLLLSANMQDLNARKCAAEDCNKCAQGSTRFCIRHGGGRRCTFEGCTRGARDKMFCAAHGGGKRCAAFLCPKAAVGGSSFCCIHGGGKKCAFDGCMKSAQSPTAYCVRHGGGRLCAEPGCSKVSRGKTNYCAAHGGGVRCKVKDCPKAAISGGDVCRAHISQLSVPLKKPRKRPTAVAVGGDTEIFRSLGMTFCQPVNVAFPMSNASSEANAGHSVIPVGQYGNPNIAMTMQLQLLNQIYQNQGQGQGQLVGRGLESAGLEVDQQQHRQVSTTGRRSTKGNTRETANSNSRNTRKSSNRGASVQDTAEMINVSDVNQQAMSAMADLGIGMPLQTGTGAGTRGRKRSIKRGRSNSPSTNSSNMITPADLDISADALIMACAPSAPSQFSMESDRDEGALFPPSHTHMMSLSQVQTIQNTSTSSVTMGTVVSNANATGNRRRKVKAADGDTQAATAVAATSDASSAAASSSNRKQRPRKGKTQGTLEPLPVATADASGRTSLPSSSGALGVSGSASTLNASLPMTVQVQMPMPSAQAQSGLSVSVPLQIQAPVHLAMPNHFQGGSTASSMSASSSSVGGNTRSDSITSLDSSGVVKNLNIPSLTFNLTISPDGTPILTPVPPPSPSPSSANYISIPTMQENSAEENLNLNMGVQEQLQRWFLQSGLQYPQQFQFPLSESSQAQPTQQSGNQQGLGSGITNNTLMPSVSNSISSELDRLGLRQTKSVEDVLYALTRMNRIPIRNNNEEQQENRGNLQDHGQSVFQAQTGGSSQNQPLFFDSLNNQQLQQLIGNQLQTQALSQVQVQTQAQIPSGNVVLMPNGAPGVLSGMDLNGPSMDAQLTAMIAASTSASNHNSSSDSLFQRSGSAVSRLSTRSTRADSIGSLGFLLDVEGLTEPLKVRAESSAGTTTSFGTLAEFQSILQATESWDPSGKSSRGYDNSNNSKTAMLLPASIIQQINQQETAGTTAALAADIAGSRGSGASASATISSSSGAHRQTLMDIPAVPRSMYAESSSHALGSSASMGLNSLHSLATEMAADSDAEVAVGLLANQRPLAGRSDDTGTSSPTTTSAVLALTKTSQIAAEEMKQSTDILDTENQVAEPETLNTARSNSSSTSTLARLAALESMLQMRKKARESSDGNDKSSSHPSKQRSASERGSSSTRRQSAQRAVLSGMGSTSIHGHGIDWTSVATRDAINMSLHSMGFSNCGSKSTSSQSTASQELAAAIALVTGEYPDISFDDEDPDDRAGGGGSNTIRLHVTDADENNTLQLSVRSESSRRDALRYKKRNSSSGSSKSDELNRSVRSEASCKSSASQVNVHNQSRAPELNRIVLSTSSGSTASDKENENAEVSEVDLITDHGVHITVDDSGSGSGGVSGGGGAFVTGSDPYIREGFV